MNREQRMNRAKRVRLAQERHGSGAALGVINPKAEEMAKDKTPKAQRVGNYFVKIKQGVRKQHTNVVPRHKLYDRAAAKGMFGNVLDFLKSKFAKKSK